jgi:hypothetical protein
MPKKFEGDFPFQLKKPNEKIFNDLEDQMRVKGEIDFDMSSVDSNHKPSLQPEEMQARAHLLEKAKSDFEGESDYPDEEKLCAFTLEQKGDPGFENTVIGITTVISGAYFNHERYHMKVIADPEALNGARLEVYELGESSKLSEKPIFMDSTIEWEDLSEKAEQTAYKKGNFRIGNA